MSVEAVPGGMSGRWPAGGGPAHVLAACGGCTDCTGEWCMERERE